MQDAPTPSGKSPLRIALVYAVVACLWILFSDRLLLLVAPDEATALEWQTYKGWFFVLGSAALIYWLIRRAVDRLFAALNREQETRQRLGLIMEHSQAAYFVYSPGTKELEVLTHSDILGGATPSMRGALAELVHPEDVPSFEQQALKYSTRHKERFSCELRLADKDGGWRWTMALASCSLPLDDGGESGPRCIGSLLDIGERREMEDTLRATNRALRILSACIESQSRAQDEPELAKDICRHVVELAGYRLAWVGLVETGGMRPVAGFGVPEDYLGSLSRMLEGSGSSGCPTTRAIRDAAIVIERDIPGSTREGDWRELAMANGLAATISLPLSDRGSAVGALTICSEDKDPFHSTEVELLAKVADDLAYGLLSLRKSEESRRAREALEESEARARATFEQAAVGICHLSLEGSFLNVNSTLCRLVGYNRQELRDRNLQGLCHEEDRASIEEGLDALLQEEQPHFVQEMRLLRKDGGFFWGMATVSLVRDKDGAPAYFLAVIEDITSRKRMEQHIDASRHELSTMADVIPDYIARFDRELRHIFVNKALCNVAGIEREEYLGRTNAELGMPPDLVMVWNEAILDVFHTGEERHLQFGFKHKGEHIELHSRLAPEHDEKGRVRTVIGVTRDITELKKTHMALQASEKRLTNAQRIARLASYERDLITGRGYWSDELYRLLGYAPGEVSNSLEMFLSHVHPDDRERIRIMFEEAKERRNDFAAEFRYVRTNKHIRHGFVTGNITRDESGRAIFYQGILQDITERKRAAEEYSLLVTAIEQASEAMAITSPHGVYQYVNPAFERITGYSRAEVLGRTPRMLASGHHDQPFYEALWKAIISGQVWQGRFVNRHRDGALYEAEANISPVRDSSGAIINFVALMRDVTEKTRMEKQLRQAQKMEAIGTLAGGIAHDFNNILAAIMGFAEIAAMETPQELASVRESLQDILTGSKRGAELVRNILTFSRQSPQDRRPVEVQPLVKEALKLLRSTLPSYISIETELKLEGGVVNADPSELQQLILNLCTNAGQAMAQGGVLRVELAPHDPTEQEISKHPHLAQGQYMRLTVRDTGPGIPPELSERIFDPFFTTKAPGEGTGLGLSIVHGVVQGLNGALELDSAPDVGTAVTVLLPLSPLGPEPRTGQEGIVYGKGRILLVEDDEVVARTLERMLKALGYEATRCVDGLQALELFRESPEAFDLVLTDHIMPGLRGVDLAARIREIRPEARVLLASGYAENIDRKDIERAGITRVLSKPLNLETLSRELHEALAESGNP